MAEIGETVGVITDWEEFKEGRWEKLGPHHFHCRFHDTHFDPLGYDENDFQDAEPCWVCFDEFQRKI